MLYNAIPGTERSDKSIIVNGQQFKSVGRFVYIVCTPSKAINFDGEVNLRICIACVA